jgi:hypothetical protein
MNNINFNFGSFKSAIMPLLQNKYVLYAVLVIAVLNIVGYLAVRNMDAVLFFILTGLLTTYFTRNMIIVLVICIVTTNFYIGTTRVISGFRSSAVEGLKNAADDEEETEGNANLKDDESGVDKKKALKEKNTPLKEKNTPLKPLKEKNTPLKPLKEKENNTGMKEPNTKLKKKSGMQNLKPASLNENEDDSDGDESGHANISASKGNRVDYAQTLGQAYDNLQNIIGEDGVQGLTEQTKGLMQQQKVLMDNMKDMEPLLKSAQGFMGQVVGNGGLAGLSKLFDGKLFGAIAPSIADNADNGKDVDADTE